MSKNRASQGPPAKAKRCRHDSTRGDGWLDDHCLLCGADGYWECDQRVVSVQVHPSGKMLVRREAALLSEPDGGEDRVQPDRRPGAMAKASPIR